MISQIINQTIITYLQTLKSLQTNTTDNSEIETPEKKKTKFLWLLFFDLLIFLSLTYTTYTSSKKLENEEQSDENSDFRPKFIKWLVVANGIRSLSLIFILLFGNPNGNNAISWLNSILHVGPAFLFVSSYMYLATFLVDLYYTNIEYNNHLMKPFLGLMVGGGYLVLIFLALITLIAKAYLTFYYISEFLMAVLYLVLGSMIIYFGRQVSFIFESKTQNKFDPSNDMSHKLSILSNSIGGLFVIKGITGVLTGGNFLTISSYPNIYDFFWFLILEIAPTVIFIMIARKKEISGERLSSVYEMDISRDSQRESQSYRPPFVS